MYIKELVLENFKSFGRRTRIPFHDDFTTISGPNGSGKSNIIDAVLFGLGLARTRGIRARKLTDLIYNPGHANEETGGDAPNEAIVEITLANEDRALSRGQIESAMGTTDVDDVDEITVRRRIRRTEDNYYSYYYLNGRSVNLSDIQDLLGQAGVTPEGYNVVMQGDVTGIINMTAGRRREIIDEIAGVSEFDEKTEAAGEELDTVAERIDEADLRIEEKEGRLDQLADEREAALAYQELREERQRYEGFQQAAKLERKRNERGEIQARISSLEDCLSEERKELDVHQARVNRLQTELEALNREIERTGEDEQLRIKREIEEIKGEIDRYEDRIDAAEDRISEAEATRREAFVNLDRTQERIDDLEEQVRDRKLEKARITSTIEDLKEERAELEAELEATDTEYESLREKLQDRTKVLDTAQREKRDVQHEQDRLLDEARRRSEELEELQNRREETAAEIERVEQELDELEHELERAEQNVEQIETVIEDLKEDKGAVEEDLQTVQDELEAARQEYAELEAQASQNGDQSYGRAVTTILNAGLEGVHGTIGQLGGVDPEYAEACETAAGGRLANVVVDDDGVGSRCIEHLKSRNAGRATFLPLTEMDERRVPSLPDDDGVIDFAVNLVDFDDQYAGAFSYVLGATLVVDTMETARRHMGSYRLVTLDGDLVEKSGAMTGGSRSGSRYSFSKSGKGRLERVAERITELEASRQEHREELEAVEQRLESARERRSDARDQRSEIQAEIDAIDRERAELEERLETLGERTEEKEAEREQVDERMQELAAEAAQTDERIKEIEAEIDELETELADSDIPDLTAAIEECNETITEHEEEIVQLDATLNELHLETEYAESSIEELHEEIETAQNRKAEEEERIEEYEDQIGTAEQGLTEKREAIEELEEDLAELKAERNDLQTRIDEATRERDEQRAEVTELENELEGLRADQRALEQEIEELSAEVDDYDPAELPDHDTVTSEIERLTEEMEALEPVNMLAIDEYDRVEEELSTLTDRRSVLEEERQAILDRIESYQTQKRETFMEAFGGINEHFEAIFDRLSAGTGSLHLENEEDPFEGGLTMEAQPADKPIQRLEAMSGGEKSLTALAFIFAIQRYRPAPFYALDEIDAFLDAVNADRVGELVDELAERAQFVVVSHRTAMLERSSRAIGVTMQENNLSAVTGIKLDGRGAEVPADD